MRLSNQRFVSSRKTLGKMLFDISACKSGEFSTSRFEKAWGISVNKTLFWTIKR
jgi:hypothetical protein